jgi:hypothetical protein
MLTPFHFFHQLPDTTPDDSPNPNAECSAILHERRRSGGSLSRNGKDAGIRSPDPKRAPTKAELRNRSG